VAAAQQLGPLGHVFEEGRLHRPDSRLARTIPDTVEEANAHPEVFAHKTVGRSPTTSPR
jgi:hypothetical protein